MLTQDQWNAAVRAVCLKAATDDSFRQKAKSDSRQALKEAGGLDLPPTAKVRFVEPRNETVITLPPFRAAGAELSDAELENVSGGLFGSLVWCVPPEPPEISTTGHKTIF